MSWTYFKFNEDGEVLDRVLPPPNTAYLAFDVCRWKVVLGFTEQPGGYSSFLGPNVDDDCCIAAIAPLNETANPDEEIIKQNGGWDGVPQYPHAEVPNLLRQ